MIDYVEKMCAMCYEVKPISQFKKITQCRKYKLKTGAIRNYKHSYYDCYCNNCRRAFNREYRRYYYEKNKERVKDINRKSNIKRKEDK